MPIYNGVWSGNTQIVVCNYVDDVLISCLNDKQAHQIAQQLEKSFKLRYLGEVKNYLGIEVDKVINGYNLSQSQKIAQLLNKWRMSDCKTAKTPMEVDNKGAANEEENQPCDVEHYKSLLGSLLHIALWTRPDITNAVNVLSRKACKPTLQDWTGLKRVLRYLKGTKDYKLKIQPSGPLWLECYADSDWAGSEDRKSSSGVAVILGKSLVDWKTKKQTCIAMSSCEAEYASLSLLVTELVWYRQILKDLHIDHQGPIAVHEDNEACIQLAESERVHSRSKHVDLRYQNVKSAVREEQIRLVYCSMADILTKPLSKIKHERSIELLGLGTCM